MTAEEAKQSITAWCSSDDDLEITGERVEPSADFALSLRAGRLSGSPVDLDVLQGQGADRITVRRSVTVQGDAAAAATDVIDTRPGGVSASVDRGAATTTVTAQTYVYVDGLSKNSFMHAVAEIARTSRLLTALTGAGTAAAEPAAAAASAATPSYASATPVEQPAAATAAAASPQMPAPSFTPTPAPQPQPAPGGQWVPTHSVPPQGLRSWAAPDPNGPVVANLAPGLPIQVTEVRGAWARIVCSNGWTGWIDGRIIGVAAKRSLLKPEHALYDVAGSVAS